MIDVVTLEGEPQPRLPGDHVRVRQACAALVCVTVYAPVR
jgi:hypothetical protein